MKGITIQFVAFFKGLIWFFPALLFYLLLFGFFHISYKPFYYYIYFFLKDHFILSGLAIGGYYLFYKFSDSFRTGEPFFNIFSFFSGFFLLVAVRDFILNIGEFNFYSLFILPFLRLFTIITISYLVDKFIDSLGIEKIIFGVLMFLVPVCAGFISYFYKINLTPLAFILSLVLFSGASAGSYLLRDI